MSTPGKNSLKVCGIMHIILSLILIVILIYAGTFLMSGPMPYYNFTFLPYLVVFIGIFVIQLVTGIFGVKYSAKPERANICYVWNIVLISLFSLFTLVQLFTPTLLILAFFGDLTLSIISLVGASRNQKAYLYAQQQASQPPYQYPHFG